MKTKLFLVLLLMIMGLISCTMVGMELGLAGIWDSRESGFDELTISGDDKYILKFPNGSQETGVITSSNSISRTITFKSDTANGFLDGTFTYTLSLGLGTDILHLKKDTIDWNFIK